MEELIKAGADGVAVDGTVRERYDGKTLEQFIGAVKKEFGTFVIADISLRKRAWQPGAAALIWWVPISIYALLQKPAAPFGTLPSPEPDYRLSASAVAGVPGIVLKDVLQMGGAKMRKALKPARTAW